VGLDREKRKEEVRDKIIEAAMKVFAQHGYFKAPVESIAEEAGTSKGLVFWYFRSKEELMIEVARKALPTDVISECLDEKLEGRELLTCIGSKYLEKYKDNEKRLLLVNTLSLANMNELIRKEILGMCYELLNEVGEKVYGTSNVENLIKMRMFFGGLLCYAVNPLTNVRSEEYLETLVNTVYSKA